MASVVISGDTSGSITLAAPAVSGNTTLTLPTSSGTLVVTGGAQTVQFAAGTVSAPSITFTGDTNTGIFSPTADTIAFTEGGVESMRINSSGNLGIGLTDFGNRLTISQTVSTTFGNAGTYIGLGGTENAINQMVLIGFGYKGAAGNEYPAVIGYTATNNGGNQAGDLIFGTRSVTTNTAPTERMRIDSSGNVGIGTSSPTTVSGFRVLDVAGSTNGGYIQTTNGTIRNSLYQSGGLGFVGTQTNHDLGFVTNGSERARITTGGALLVGTTALASSERVRIQAASVSTGLAISMANSAGTYNAVEFYDGDSTLSGTIAVNNAANTTAYNTSSDYRLKENIAPMTGALEKVNQLNPVTWVWKNTPNIAGQGFIAHELQEIIPDAVTGEKDAVDKDGSPKYQGVDTSFLVATLTAAIQEQQQIINDLKARIETLENK